jgi:serine/threonine-protein kinase
MSDVLNHLKATLADRYTVERELGSGGMAVVYLAQDLRHERRVAIKVLHPELTSVVAAERLLREIKLTASLAHPHILPVHDSGEADGFLYFVMPYVEGESLRERLNREKQLPVDEAVRIAREVADALNYVGTAPEGTDKFYLRVEELIRILKGRGYEYQRIDELLSGGADDYLTSQKRTM